MPHVHQSAIATPDITARSKPIPTVPQWMPKQSRPEGQVDGRHYFETEPTDRVALTSTLFSGGDWHWRFCASGGDILAECAGYRNEEDCRAAITALQRYAASAHVAQSGGPFDRRHVLFADNRSVTHAVTSAE